MKQDKIFNNTYGDQSNNEEPISFTVAPAYLDDLDPDDKLHYDLLFARID
jgi:hypothetical protein